jgi:hypothetical protein
VIEWAWVLAAWAVVGGGLVLWFGAALAVLEGPRGRRPDRSTCACCRHDAVAHEHAGPATSCTQCPCDGFRRTC